MIISFVLAMIGAAQPIGWTPLGNVEPRRDPSARRPRFHVRGRIRAIRIHRDPSRNVRGECERKSRAAVALFPDPALVVRLRRSNPARRDKSAHESNELVDRFRRMVHPSESIH
jgi:hypothetical protein